MAYKILNNQVILTPDYLPKKKHTRHTRNNLNKESQLEEKHSRLVTTEKNFFYSVPTLWNNSVAEMQAMSTRIDAFKKYFL